MGEKPGVLDTRPAGFSICPETHRQVLEITGTTEQLQIQADGCAFHFSALNYGYYGFINHFNL
jgi:hypothetical protein